MVTDEDSDQTKIVITSCVMAVVMNNATAQSILQWEVTFIIVRYEEIVDMRITSSAWIHPSVVQPTTLHLLLHVRYDCSIHSIQYSRYTNDAHFMPTEMMGTGACDRFFFFFVLLLLL